ncbi:MULTISPECIES: type II toxin-antitoxin system VapC family toxin [unclassified Pseudomonas]|uniref:type II toxin-antitoxin system VapC family toxin n=1 Tax=unclassified Pseudomonas TaxID=196821 RepID=UPI000A1F4589|nr:MULTISPECIES: type II toxin-antitoxin system VapC family toxin [unclassified Pseudomonas]
MVILDTNALVLFFGKRLNSDDSLRMQGLFHALRAKRESIGIPAQVWAEFLDQAGERELIETQTIFKTAAFRLLPYDLKAVMETVEVVKAGRSARKAIKGEKRPRQSVKVDWQIIAIAKANGARLLITNDVDMLAESQRSGISSMRICDLPIPDHLRQHDLILERK